MVREGVSSFNASGSELHPWPAELRVDCLQGGPELLFGRMAAEKNGAIDLENGNGGKFQDTEFTGKRFPGVIHNPASSCFGGNSCTEFFRFGQSFLAWLD